MSGTVFEDLDYGGGARPRPRRSPPAPIRPAARVELYDAAEQASYSFTATDARRRLRLSPASLPGQLQRPRRQRLGHLLAHRLRPRPAAGARPFRTDAASGRRACPVTDHVGKAPSPPSSTPATAPPPSPPSPPPPPPPRSVARRDAGGGRRHRRRFRLQLQRDRQHERLGPGFAPAVRPQQQRPGKRRAGHPRPGPRARRFCVHAQRRSGARGPARRHRQPAQRGGRRRDRAGDCAASRGGRVHVGRRHDPDCERGRHQRVRAGDGGHGRSGWPRVEHGTGA